MRAHESAADSPLAAIGVDFDELARVSRVLRVLAREVGDRSFILQGNIGDPDLAQALRHAEQDWSSHRQKLHSLLANAASAVESSLASYQAAENELARAAT